MTLEELSERSRIMATGLNQKLLERTTVYQPRLDCVLSQNGSCTELFTSRVDFGKADSSPEEILNVNPDYVPCTECRKSEDPAI